MRTAQPGFETWFATGGAAGGPPAAHKNCPREGDQVEARRHGVGDSGLVGSRVPRDQQERAQVRKEGMVCSRARAATRSVRALSETRSKVGRWLTIRRISPRPPDSPQPGPIGGAHLDQAGSTVAQDLGRRKESPISTISPRETTTSRFRARVATVSMTAAAQLLTTRAEGAPVRRANRSRTWTWREPRRPCSRSSSRLVGPEAASWRASKAPGPGWAPQVGVEDHTGDVQDPAQGRLIQGLELPRGVFQEEACRIRRQTGGPPQAGGPVAQGLQDPDPAVGFKQSETLWRAQQQVQRGDPPPGMRLVHRGSRPLRPESSGFRGTSGG